MMREPPIPITLLTADMPAMALSPYTPAQLHRVAKAMAVRPWRHSEGRPPPIISLYSTRLGLNLDNSTLARPNRCLTINIVPNPTTCPIKVPSPAPSTPMPRPRIKTASSTILSIPPTAIPIVPTEALPSNRSWIFSTYAPI